MDVDFAELQDIHHTWGQDVWIKAKHTIDPSIILIESLLKSIYFTYAYSQAKEITQEQLTSVESSFKTLSSPPAFYLNDSLQSLHVTEFLARHGYRLTSQDAWMLYNPKHSVKISSYVNVTDIDIRTFEDFSAVLSVVFAEFDQNTRYLEICKKSLIRKPDNGIKDFSSTFYVIHDESTPASGAAMFYSVEKNFAYLHNAGTLEAYRGKGYQSALINHRVNLALSLGISRIYSIVSRGSTSWANMIRCGLDEAQRPIICSKKLAVA